MIDFLYDEGADFDHMNDEGFTALTMALTRYIAILHDVVLWERAFLPMLALDEPPIGRSNALKIKIVKKYYKKTNGPFTLQRAKG